LTGGQAQMLSFSMMTNLNPVFLVHVASWLNDEALPPTLSAQVGPQHSSWTDSYHGEKKLSTRTFFQIEVVRMAIFEKLSTKR
jgi:hypothetical protein